MANCISLALGVKMNILNFLPGLLVLLFQYRGIIGTVEGLSIIGLIQFLLPAPFFFSKRNPYLTRAYFTSAFDFSRQFLYEWTVNWRFISEKAFLSRERAVALLAGHVSSANGGRTWQLTWTSQCSSSSWGYLRHSNGHQCPAAL